MTKFIPACVQTKASNVSESQWNAMQKDVKLLKSTSGYSNATDPIAWSPAWDNLPCQEVK